MQGKDGRRKMRRHERRRTRSSTAADNPRRRKEECRRSRKHQRTAADNRSTTKVELRRRLIRTEADRRRKRKEERRRRLKLTAAHSRRYRTTGSPRVPRGRGGRTDSTLHTRRRRETEYTSAEDLFSGCHSCSICFVRLSMSSFISILRGPSPHPTNPPVASHTGLQGGRRSVLQPIRGKI